MTAAPDTDGRILALAADQGGVATAAQLSEQLGRDGLRRAVRTGRWLQVHRGTYCPRALHEAAADDPVLAHRLQCAARVLASGRPLVVSHRSAAVLHGLPLLQPYRGAPELTVVRAPASPPVHVTGLRTSGVPTSHRVVLQGVPATTRPRTVADLARRLDRPAGVVMADGALRAGVRRAAVLAVLDDCAGWPGAAAAVRTVTFADPRAESALESLTRVWFAVAGLAAPELQVSFCHPQDGAFIARVDFFWPDQRTICEMDGRVKYVPAEPTAAGDGPEDDVVWREKLREDALRDLGLEVVRGYWSDGADGGAALVQRVRRAFARAAVRGDSPTYGLLRSA